MKKFPVIAPIFAVGLASLTPGAQGQVFKCKDESGKVTYTDVPCLRSETGSVVDTRAAANVADHSSLRQAATRLPRNEAPAAHGPTQAASPAPAPPPPAPAPSSARRSSGY